MNKAKTPVKVIGKTRRLSAAEFRRLTESRSKRSSSTKTRSSPAPCSDALKKILDASQSGATPPRAQGRRPSSVDSAGCPRIDARRGRPWTRARANRERPAPPRPRAAPLRGWPLSARAVAGPSRARPPAGRPRIDARRCP
jgi:hypothetical protein